MISRQTKQRVRATYDFACGYCGVTEAEVGALLTIDHFQPRSEGGSDDPDNLVYACHACNEFKGAAWDSQIPPVLHPMRANVNDHFTEQPDGTLLALTDAGSRHIALLRLNRPPLVRRRFNYTLQRQAAQTQQSVEERIASLEKAVRTLTDQLGKSVERRDD